MADQIQIRRDTRTNWASANPRLAEGEIGLILNNDGNVTGSVSMKVGDGHSYWNDLPEQAFVEPDAVQNLSGSLTDVSSSLNDQINTVSGSLNDRITDVSSSLNESLSTAVQDLSTNKADKDVGATTGNLAMFDNKGNPVDAHIPAENVAQQDGTYDSLVAGFAKDLMSEEEVTEQAALGIIAPDTEISDGVATIRKIQGDYVNWHQLYDETEDPQSQISHLASRMRRRLTFEGGDELGVFFAREILSGVDITTWLDHMSSTDLIHLQDRIANGQEEFYPPIITDDKDEHYAEQTNYSGVHTAVRLEYSQIISEFDPTRSPFFIDGGTGRNVMDMSLLMGVESKHWDASPTDFKLPDSAPSTVPEMLAWFNQKVGLSAFYGFHDSFGGKAYGVSAAFPQIVSSENLLDAGESSGTAILPYYEWYEGLTNKSGVYRIEGGDVRHIQIESLAGYPGIKAVGTGSGWEITVPEGDALKVTVTGNSITNTRCWQVWDDSKNFSEIGPYSSNRRRLEPGRVYGKLNGTGSLTMIWQDGFKLNDVIDLESNEAIVSTIEVHLTGDEPWEVDANRSVFTPGFVGFLKGKGYAYCNGYLMTSNLVAKSADKFMTEDNESVWIDGDGLLYFHTMKTDDPNRWVDYLHGSGGLVLWVELASPRIYTDLYYDVRNSTSVGEPELVPLSQAFNRKFEVCNTGTRMEWENWDGTPGFRAYPKSISPIYKTAYPGNYVEYLNTLKQQGVVTPQQLQTTLSQSLSSVVSQDLYMTNQTALVTALNDLLGGAGLPGAFTLEGSGKIEYSK